MSSLDFYAAVDSSVYLLIKVFPLLLLGGPIYLLSYIYVYFLSMSKISFYLLLIPHFCISQSLGL